MANNKTATIVVAIPEEAFKFSEEFLSFIYQDEMEGVFDLFEMTKNERTAKRIPSHIRGEYEQHYMVAGELLDNMMSEIQKSFETIQVLKDSSDSEVLVDCMNIFVEQNAVTITNMVPTEFIENLENSIEKFKQDYTTIPQEMKVFIINSAVEQFVAKCAAKEAH